MVKISCCGQNTHMKFCHVFPLIYQVYDFTPQHVHANLVFLQKKRKEETKNKNKHLSVGPIPFQFERETNETLVVSK